MTNREFLQLLEEVLELSPNTLHGDEKLHDIEQWDSLAVLGFMAKIDEIFGIQLPPDSIVKADSIQTLQTLLPKA